MDRVDRRGVAAYIGIAFGLTWMVDFAMIAVGVRFDAMPGWAFAVVAGTMFFPALAAFVVRKWITREGFASAGLRFGGWRPYLLMLLGTPVLFGLVYGFSWLLGAVEFDPSMSAVQEQLAAMGGEAAAVPPQTLLLTTLIATLTVAPLLTAVATFGEEFGWTGYLLPKLLPLGKWWAALLYGLVWGIWHLPIIAFGYNYPGYPIVGPVMMCLFTIAAALLMTAIRLRTGSVLTTTWMHAMINTQARGIWVLLFVGAQPLVAGMTGAVGIVVLGTFGAWLLSRTPGPETRYFASQGSLHPEPTAIENER